MGPKKSFAKRQNAFNRFICVLLATAKELSQNDTFANSTDKYICVQVFTGTDWNPRSRCIHSSLTKYSTVHYLVRAKNAWASLYHLVIASYGDHIMVIYCPCRECWGNFSIRCSLATQSNSGSLVIAFCIFLFSSDQTYFGGERSNMLVLHLATNRPWRRSWETKVRTEGLWWLLQSREKDVTEHQILLSVMWGCNRLDFLFFEKIRGPLLPLVEKSWRPQDVLTPSCILWPAALGFPSHCPCGRKDCSVLLFYCSTVLLCCYCSVLLRVQLSSNTDPLSVAVTCGCAGAQVVPSLLGQDQVQTHLLHHISNLVKQREKKWLRVVLIFLSFRTPTARRWRSGRRTTPSSRMSTTCATPRWPSGWRMLRR